MPNTMENQKENLEKAASILIKDLRCLKKGEKCCEISCVCLGLSLY
jgi:hypothetical protein